MKKPLFLLFTGLLLSCLIPVHTVAAQELPTQKETLENIIKVNDYFMKKVCRLHYSQFLRSCTSQQYMDAWCIL